MQYGLGPAEFLLRNGCGSCGGNDYVVQKVMERYPERTPEGLQALIDVSLNLVFAKT